MRTLNTYILTCFLTMTAIVLLGQIQKDELSTVLDFTVLQNGSMTLMYDGIYTRESRNITGLIQAYDYKGRLQYDRQYRLSIPDSLLTTSMTNPRISEAYGVSLTKNNSLFYGQINTANPLSFFVILDKRGRIKKQIIQQVDYTKISQELEGNSFRSKAFFWLYAQQNQLRISGFMAPTKKLYSQVYIRNIKSNQEEIMFDSFSLKKDESTTLIHSKDDVKINWGHRIKGHFSKDSGSFKLTETPQHFYFILYENQGNIVRPIIYVLEKRSGKITIQAIPERLRA